MKKKPLHLKQIGYDEPIFYWYELGEATYALYDSDMGEPISYGSLNLVVGTIRVINEEVLARKRKKCILYYFKRDTTNGWRKTAPPVLFNWNPDSADKKAADDKKKQENTDKKTGKE
jgi:hypothetical protein